ncbi:MAG TPA: GAF domain-containing protein [Chloroflexi bacterium]|nr:GAF domain-containing protein [Chloroflexota bacterium]
MQIIYLTPASISTLTQFILAFAIAAYFLYLSRKTWRREQKPITTMLLTAAFSSIAAYILLLFLNASLHPNLRFYAMPLEGVALALILTFALQFAYRFPSPFPGKAWEARFALWLTILYTLWETQIALSRFTMIQQGYAEFRPAIADYPLVTGFLWLLVILFRQTARASDSPGSSFPRSAWERGGGTERLVWRNLWRPRSRDAHAARAFFLFSVMPLFLTATGLSRAYGILPNGVAEATLSLGMLFMLIAFALVYLNYLPETTSFMVKLVGVTLAAGLAVVGSIAWIITPAYIAAYGNDHFMAEKQSIRFTPVTSTPSAVQALPKVSNGSNPQRGYDVAAIPFHFDPDLGVDLGLADTRVALEFEFPFYGQSWDEVYLLRDGAISFDQILNWQYIKHRYGPTAAIFPLAVDFVNSNAWLDESSGGFFVRSAADKFTVTWYRLPELHSQETRYTVQLTLYPDGVFEIAYDDLPATQNYDIYEAWNTAWLIGATPGCSDIAPHHIRFTADLPFTGGSGGIIENYHLYFRRYLHQIFVPLAYFTLASSLFALIGFPLFFRLNLIKPLNSLLEGVKQVNAGNLETEVSLAYRDEIGFLTEFFNAATAKQRDLVSNLETRVAERTVELEAYVAQNVRLFEEEQRQRNIVESLRQSMLAFSRSLDHTAVIAEILAQLREIIHYDSVGFFLQDGDNLRLASGVGLNPALIGTLIPLDSQNHTAQVFKRRQPHAISDVRASAHWQAFPDAEQIRSSMAAPLLFGQEAIGVLTLDRFDAQSFTQEEVQILQAFANQAAIAIKNAELYQQAQKVAVLEERNRLAQELHDAVNQTLFSAAIIAETAPDIWREDPQRGMQVLAELRLLNQSALSEMRTLLLELRPAALTEKKFGELLHYLSKAFSARSQIAVNLDIEGDCILPPDVQIAFYRITQESFNNIAKHAQAIQSSLSFDCMPEQAILSISDNGRGFDLNRVPAGHLGLEIMRERATKIGATLEIETQPGRGTFVTLLWVDGRQ